VIEYPSFVNGLPLNSLVSLAAVIVISLAVTVNLPCSRNASGKLAVTFCVPFHNVYPVIVFALFPTFVCVPTTEAVTLVTPAGNALWVKFAFVKGVPSYCLLLLAAVIVIASVVFGVTVSVPSTKIASGKNAVTFCVPFHSV
jgi:hypothetical protein